jgi:hypothetical protein
MLRYDQIQVDVLLDVSDIPESGAKPGPVVTTINLHETGELFHAPLVNSDADTFEPINITMYQAPDSTTEKKRHSLYKVRQAA